jgi:hemerythrin-like domain-containing protein
MDAIEYLTDQHREIDSLFDQLESAARTKTKLRLRRKLVDLLAVHDAIEDRIFYPAARDAGARELLPRALAEHLWTERLVARVVALDEMSGEEAARLADLREWHRRHAEAEEKELFPRARERLAPDQLAALAWRMARLADLLMAPGVGARERVTVRTALA